MEPIRLLVLVLSLVPILLAVSCEAFQRREGEGPGLPGGGGSFASIVQVLQARADAVVLEGDGGSRVLVSPRLQGRLMTCKVGAVESTGLVNLAAITKGEVDPHFNNFGGFDRFWIGPEAGQFGIYFPAGADFTRDTWKVPADFDSGPFPVLARDADKVVMERDLEVANYIGTRFKARVRREVGILPAAKLPEELGVRLPEGVHYCGAYSSNTLTNAGGAAWSPKSGLIGIWILGQFNPSSAALVIGPFRSGDDAQLGPAFNDDYFGKVSKETPSRLKLLGNAVLFRADSRRVGKFGISQKRTTGLAGSMDFEKSLLTVVEFEVPTTPERYGNSAWVKEQPNPFQGDLFQSYNNGGPGPGDGPAEVPFYELESASPVRPLAAGESLTHRHATHHFQGDLEKLSAIARQLLGVDLAQAKAAMLP